MEEMGNFLEGWDFQGVWIGKKMGNCEIGDGSRICFEELKKFFGIRDGDFCGLFDDLGGRD